MPPRLRFLLVVAALFAVLGTVAWLLRGGVAAPTAVGGAAASEVRAHDVAADGAPTHAAGATTPADPGRGQEPAREALAIEPQSLRGMVVDAAGTPVAGAAISSIDDSVAMPEATSGADGSFAVERPATYGASHVQLLASHHRLDRASQWVAWGCEDARLVLQPRVAVEVRVVDERGEPVPVARVSCESAEATDKSRVAFEARGDAWCGAACRGWNAIAIESPEGSAVAREKIDQRLIAVTDPGPVQVRLVAAALLPTEVHVVDPDGASIADAKIEVIDARGATVTAYQRTVKPYVRLGPALLGEATTDASGTARPLAPLGRSFVVRATRDGFAPALVGDLRVPADQPVVVRLGRGANCRGRVLADPYLAEQIAAGRCLLRLAQSSGARCWPDSVGGIALGSDGSFSLAGAPPGAWEVRLFHPCGAPELSMRACEPTGVSVELHDGDNAPLIVDLRDWRWSEVDLLLLVDGEPIGDTLVDFRSTAQPHTDAAVVRCDADGRCATRLRPGSYGFAVAERFGALTVTGDRVAQKIDLRTGEMVVTFVDGRGLPVRGLRSSTVRRLDFVDVERSTPAADGDGVLRARRSAGEWALFADTIEIQAALDAFDWSRDDVQLQLARTRRLLGTVTVRAGEVTKATFVVPDDVPR